jgi:hypothetical protein
MKFELHITCSKEIDTLAIDFADGTSCITSKDDPKPPKNKVVTASAPKKDRKTVATPREDVALDLDEDYAQETEAVGLPVIADHDRPVKIAQELQNLDI